MLKLLTAGFGLLLLSGCASYGVIDNIPVIAASATESCSIKNVHTKNENSGEIFMVLAFSGGGTRTAALA